MTSAETGVQPGGGQAVSGPEPEKIEAIFRNGSVAAVGVLTGFSLTFLTAWAANPLPWQLHDLFGIVPLAIGIVCELIALAALLHPNSLERARYDRAVRIFLIGLTLVGCGVALAIGVDAITIAERR